MAAVESNPSAMPSDGSKLRKFFKRFGRRPSDVDGEEGGLATSNEVSQIGTNGDINGSKKSASMRSRKGSKSGASAPTKGRRSDSLAGRFFNTSSNAPPLPTSNSRLAGANPTTEGMTKSPKAVSGLPLSANGAFGSTKAEGLANTLTIPPDGSPAPQISGLPTHEPIATKELMSVPATTPDGFTTPQAAVSESNTGNAESNQRSSITAAGDTTSGNHNDTAQVNENERKLIHQTSYGSSVARSARAASASEVDSLEAGIRGRDSLDNRTMDTGKSRASTKPTTLMSMDSPETGPGYAPMAQIAQHRHGDLSSSNGRMSSHRGNNTGNEVYGTSIQFVPQPPLGRTASGTIVQLPGSVEEVPYANVPTLSRPHPSNNPIPSGIPADNASMLTLASSTAAASIGGGAASSRGHSHATPSLGGARSIGGSLMGERRNSSDTYASVKALPPLSRRGSDESTRTGKSIAASATGRSSAQAMMNPSGTNLVTAGPGAPYDRIR